VHFAGDALHAERELARIGLGVGDELVDRLHAQAWPHDQQHRLEHGDQQRPEVAARVEVGLRLEKLGHHDRRGWGEQQRIAIGRSLRHLRSADPHAATGLVLDDELLPEIFLGRRRGDAHRGIDAGAGPFGTMMRIGRFG